MIDVVENRWVFEVTSFLRPFLALRCDIKARGPKDYRWKTALFWVDLFLSFQQTFVSFYLYLLHEYANGPKNGAQKTWNQFNIKIPPDRKPYRQNRLEKPDSSLEPECRTYLCPTGGNAWCFTTPVSTTATATTSTTTNTTSATTTNNTISTTLLHNTSLQHIFQHSSCIHVLCVYGRWWVVVGFTLKTSTKRSEDQQQEIELEEVKLGEGHGEEEHERDHEGKEKQKKESAAGRLQNTNETRKNHLTCNVWKRRFLYKRIQWRQSFSGSTWIWGVKVFTQLFNNGYERSWSTLVSNWSKFLGNQVEFRRFIAQSMEPWNRTKPSGRFEEYFCKFPIPERICTCIWLYHPGWTSCISPYATCLGHKKERSLLIGEFVFEIVPPAFWWLWDASKRIYVVKQDSFSCLKRSVLVCTLSPSFRGWCKFSGRFEFLPGGDWELPSCFRTLRG